MIRIAQLASRATRLMPTLAGTALLAAMTVAMPASAQTVLTFEGVRDQSAVGNFYNGGAGGNFGISFSSNALGLIDSDAGGTGNIANEPSPSTVLFFLSGSAATMNVSAGFTTGFSFFYSSAQAASVSVFSGLDGTGTLLASLPLVAQYNTACSGDPTGAFCNFSPVGVTFAGTARSVNFAGAANFVVFDNITLGAGTPGTGTGAVPEPPTWAMMLMGFGAMAGAMRYRRRATGVAFAA